jgi:hypothetical protein
MNKSNNFKLPKKNSDPSEWRLVCYSIRKLFTGFASAALMVRKSDVNNAVNCIPTGRHPLTYSVLKLFTGFAVAAFIAVYPTVNHAILMDDTIVIAKKPIPIMIL